MKNNFIYRLFTKKNSLPDFIIIGAQKSGTSTLQSALKKHPDVYMAQSNTPGGEVHFFDNNWNRGVDWYNSFFQKPHLLQGEKTPNYFSKSKCHKKMASVVPDSKLILILRNPVDRAYSQWNHYNQVMEKKGKLKWGWEITTFDDAIERNLGKSFTNGLYIKKLESLLNYFSREQLYICFTHDLKTCMPKEMEKIYHFLNISIIKTESEIIHKRSYKEPMKMATRKKLLNLYEPYNEKLFDLLGYRIEEWSE